MIILDMKYAYFYNEMNVSEFSKHDNMNFTMDNCVILTP